MFPADGGGVVSGKVLWKRLRDYTDELGFPPGIDIHSLRRSYATHLQTEYGYDITFVQLQLGHKHAATTGIYTILEFDYRSRQLEHVQTETLYRSGVERKISAKEGN